MAGVDQLHLAGAAGGLVLAQHPDIGGYAGVHKLVGGQLHDGVQPVVFQYVAADLAGAAARVAGEQRRAVLYDRHPALRRQLRKAVQNEQLLAVGDLRQARREPAQLALRGLRLHRLLLPLPVDAKGRVADAVLEGVAGELVVGQGVAEPHVVRVAAANHHVRLGDGEGRGVELLAEAADGHVGVQLVDALLHAGEHLAGAHGHVVHGDVARVGQVRVGEQQVGHQVDDVPAGEVGPGFLAEGLGEAPHQVLEDIAAVHGADLLRAQIALGGVELLDNQVQRVALHHAADHRVEVELGKHVLDVGRKARQVVAEVGLDVLRVRKQAVKGVPAGVVELVAGSAGQEAVDHRQVLHLPVGVLHRLPRGQQAVVKALHHRHRQDHQPVFMGLERAAQHVRHVPDHRRLFSYVRADRADFVVRHGESLLVWGYVWISV